VRLHGRVADVELAPDLRVRQAAGDQAKHIELTLGELLELRWRSRTGNAGELFDDAFRDRRREQCISAGNDPDGGKESLGRVVFEHESAGTRAEGLVDVFVEVERRQDQNPSRFVGCEDPPGRLETVQFRHADVHQHHRRLKAGRLLDRLEAVACLGHDFDVGLSAEQHPEAGANHRLVVRDENADAHDASRSRGRLALRTNPPAGAVPAFMAPP
jgi:hypothetical protein